MASRSDSTRATRETNEALFKISIDPSKDPLARALPQVHYGFDRTNFIGTARDIWFALPKQGDLPSISSFRTKILPYFRVHGALLELTSDGGQPHVSHLGLVVAQSSGVSRSLRALSDAPLDSILARLPSFFAEIIETGRPVSFKGLPAVGATGGTRFDGVLLPFHNGGDRPSHVFAILDECDRPIANEENVFELTADLVAEGARLKAHNDVLDLSLEQVDAPVAPLAVAEIATNPLEAYLATAREFAERAKTADGRSREALYDALGQAYDFAIACESHATELDALLDGIGVKQQKRAPMTPIVKLVFGAKFDRTRVTEYATVLSHARKCDVTASGLPQFLAQADGGIKGIVAEARKLKRGHSEKGSGDRALRTATARKLRALAASPIEALDLAGEEFAVLLVRREADGSLAAVGTVAPTSPLLERVGKDILAQKSAS